jgi:AAA+ superfamily predicted ATPase
VLFELQAELPHKRFFSQSERLVGFQARYERLHRDLRLLIDREGLETWSKHFHGQVLPVVTAVQDRCPLVLFHGDVGTGKTATAEACADRLARELDVEGILLKLSTRVRGGGMVGEMSSLIGKAFDVLVRSAGKGRIAVLIIDEADSLTASREMGQSHHEDKVAVNTLIQRIDDVRAYGGRVLVFLCTNRLDALDPAVLRRAGLREAFDRPGPDQRRELFQMDCAGLDLAPSVIDELVRLTGDQLNGAVCFTYSDIRTRVLPEALARAFPERQLSAEDLIAAAKAITPTPAMARG